MLVSCNRRRLGLAACWGHCMVAWRSYAPWNVLQLHTATMQEVMKGVRACPTLGMVLINCHHCFALPFCRPLPQLMESRDVCYIGTHLVYIYSICACWCCDNAGVRQQWLCRCCCCGCGGRWQVAGQVGLALPPDECLLSD